MKKIFLPVIFFLLLLFPVGVYAQDYKNCLNAQIAERSACTQVRNDCVAGCTAPEGPADENCIRGCDKNLNACYSRASANYNLCVKGGKQITPGSEDKKLSSDEKLLNCEELSKLSSSEDCLPSIMVDYKVWCARPGENLTEFTSDQIKLVPPNRAPDYTVDPSLTEEELKKCQEDASSGQTRKNKPGKDDNRFNIFGANPFQTWLNLRTFAELGAYIYSDAIIEDTEKIFLPGGGMLGREARELEEAKKFFDEATKRLAELEGKVGEADPSLTSARERVELAKINLMFKGGGALIELQPINGQNGVLEKGPVPILESGAVDVIVEPQNGQQFQMQTPNAEIFVIGTQFSVIYDTQNSQTLVAVYKGEVEVKTKDGKTARISPSGDNPGVVVVTQRLSPIKLGITGVVLVGILGGVVWLLKKKFASKGITKKRK